VTIAQPRWSAISASASARRRHDAGQQGVAIDAGRGMRGRRDGHHRGARRVAGETGAERDDLPPPQRPASVFGPDAGGVGDQGRGDQDDGRGQHASQPGEASTRTNHPYVWASSPPSGGCRPGTRALQCRGASPGVRADRGADARRPRPAHDRPRHRGDHDAGRSWMGGVGRLGGVPRRLLGRASPRVGRVAAARRAWQLVAGAGLGGRAARRVRGHAAREHRSHVVGLPPDAARASPSRPTTRSVRGGGDDAARHPAGGDAAGSARHRVRADRQATRRHQRHGEVPPRAHVRQGGRPVPYRGHRSRAAARADQLVGVLKGFVHTRLGSGLEAAADRVVDDLLERQACHPGTTLEPSSPHRRRVSGSFASRHQGITPTGIMMLLVT